MKALIVGAGLAGLTAGVILKRRGWEIRVLDTRQALGGNCADSLENGVFVHKYGPHIFHTNDDRVWKFMNEFTGFTDYQHRVMAITHLSKEPVHIPYSLATQVELGRQLSDSEIIDTFFRRYSEKMWGMRYEQIPTSITSRVQLRRDSTDTRYFLDKHQGMPRLGYDHMFTCMATDIGLGNFVFGAPQYLWRNLLPESDLLIFTGPLDEYYGYEHGRLPYRAIDFWFRQAQPVQQYAVVNYCNDMPYTRITDFSRFYEGTVKMTVTCTERPTAWYHGDSLVPSYPMRGFPKADQILAEYEKIPVDSDVILGGRLGAYKYMNMDAVVADMMHKLEVLLGERVYE